MANALPLPRLARTEAEPLLATVGNTPLIRLERIPLDFPGVEIFGKAEYFNPGGSVKDQEVIEACQKLKVNLVLTGVRHFRH